MKAFVYQSIENKKSGIQACREIALAPRDRLIRILEIMDLNAALAKSNPGIPRRDPQDEINWIDLTLKK